MSSSAQLVLVPWLLGWEAPADRTAFGAALHAGSCAGIAWARRDDLLALTRRDLTLLLAASVPAAAAGALAADAVEARLGRPPQLAGLLTAFGALMWWVDARAARCEAGAPAAVPSHGPAPGSTRGRSASRDSRRGGRWASVAPRQVAAAALAQTAALVPGVSRSGATLTALRAAGVDRATGRRTSLLMSLPVTAGAAALSLARADRTAVRELGPALAAGTLTAALSAAACATADRARPGRSLAPAALYRLGLAAVVAHRLYRKGAV